MGILVKGIKMPESCESCFVGDRSLCKYGCILTETVMPNIVHWINDIEIVRCKYCKWHENEEPGMVYCPNIVGGWVSNNFYCGNGRRNDEVEE